jgi:hypothetical protein
MTGVIENEARFYKGVHPVDCVQPGKGRGVRLLTVVADAQGARSAAGPFRRSADYDFYRNYREIDC